MSRQDALAPNATNVLHDHKLTPDSFDVKIVDPFLVFEIRGIFDRSGYERLRDEFPPKSMLPRTWVDRGNKSFLDNRGSEFFAS